MKNNILWIWSHVYFIFYVLMIHYGNGVSPFKFWCFYSLYFNTVLPKVKNVASRGPQRLTSSESKINVDNFVWNYLKTKNLGFPITITSTYIITKKLEKLFTPHLIIPTYCCCWMSQFTPHFIILTTFYTIFMFNLRTSLLSRSCF